MKTPFVAIFKSFSLTVYRRNAGGVLCPPAQGSEPFYVSDLDVGFGEGSHGVAPLFAGTSSACSDANNRLRRVTQFVRVAHSIDVTVHADGFALLKSTDNEFRKFLLQTLPVS